MLYMCYTKWATLGHPLCPLVKKKGMEETNVYTNALCTHAHMS